MRNENRVDVKPEEAYRLINHGPCCLITTGDGTRRNVAPINWTMPVSEDPPLFAIAVESGIFTDELLSVNAEFAINVMGEESSALVFACGRRSGRNGDKFDALLLDVSPCSAIKPPRLTKSAAHIECRVTAAHKYKDVRLYVAQALRAEAESRAWDGKRFLVENVRTLHHLGSGVFAVTERLASRKAD